MPETTETREPHRSFTVRVPLSMYLEIAELARQDGIFLNKKANELLRLGMGRHVSIEEALVRMLRQTMTEDQE